MSTAGDTVEVLVALGEPEHKRIVKFLRGCSLCAAIEETFKDVLEKTGQQVSHLQMWNKDYDEYIDIESEDKVVNNTRIKVVVINCQQTGPESHCEEARMTIVPYCTQSMFIEPDQPTASGSSDDGCASGHALITKLWDKDKLLVFFMNPEKLENWKCGEGILNVQNLMDWVGAWKSAKHPNIPVFGRTYDVEKADIRVEFIDGGGTRSKVGNDAAKTAKSEATMFLSLEDNKTRKFLVIHEFGHALGLLHEHQRSDFWEVAKKLIDVDIMRNDLRIKSADFDKNWFQYKGGSMEQEYDPDSVMHYWFRISWLKNKDHMDLSKVEKDGRLTSKQKAVLRGIHTRNNKNPDPNPSENDLKCLQELYGPASSPALAGPPQETITPFEIPDKYHYVALSPDHLGTLTDAAFEARDKWKDIALGLGLTKADINSIHTYNLGNDQKSFSDILSKWLQGGAKNKSLGALLRVLAIKNVGKDFLSKDVADAILSYNGGPGSKRPKH